MGKPKVRGSRANRKAGGNKKKAEEPKYSIEDLLERASDLLDECQFDAAEKFCQRALEEGLNILQRFWINTYLHLNSRLLKLV